MKRVYSILSLFLAMAFLTGGVSTVDYAKRGEDHRSNGRYDLAISDLNIAIQQNPRNAWAYGSRGEAYRAKGMLNEALSDLTRAIQLDSNYSFAIGGRGETYRLMGRMDDAIADFDRALQINPNYGFALASRGEAYRNKGMHDNSISDFSRAIQLDPNYSFAYGGRGETYRRMGRMDDALADFNKAIQLDPNYAFAYGSRGEIQRTKGFLDRSVSDFSRAIQIDPNYAFAYGGRGETYRRQDKIDSALRDFDRAIQLDPNYSFAYGSRGELHRGKGNLDKSVSDFSRAIQIDSSYAFAYGGRGETYRRLGRYDDALYDLNRAIQLDPIYSFAFGTRGEVHRQKGMYREAISDLNRAIELDPNYSWARDMLAEAKKSQNLAGSKYTPPPPRDSMGPEIYMDQRAIKVVKRTKETKVSGTASDSSGISSVYVNNTRASLDSDGRFEAWVSLVMGDNQVRVVAKDSHNNETVKTVSITRKPKSGPKPPSPVIYAGGGGAYHALVIGINNYKHLDRLRTAEADAQKVSRLLSNKFGFKVVTLTNERATRDSIISEFNKLRQSLNKEDNLLIYYAGHGYFDEDTATAYWLPVDAQLDNDVKWIIADTITTNIKRMAAGHVLVVADSCYSGTLTRSSKINLQTGSKRAKYIEKMQGKRARVLIASGGNEPVVDAGGGGHSVFARAFVDALEEFDEDVFTSEELLVGHIKETVAGSVEQTPEFSVIRNSGHQGGDFIFRRK